MDYKRLEILSKEFTYELDLAKLNLDKAKKSEAFKNLDSFIEPNVEFIEYLEINYNKNIKELFNLGSDDENIFNDLIKFFKTNIIQLKYLNRFFEESKNRGDI
jgi:hypothetical protein